MRHNSVCHGLRRLAGMLAVLLLFICSGCESSAGFGGPLPTLPPGWTDKPDGDVLAASAPGQAPVSVQTPGSAQAPTAQAPDPFTVTSEPVGIGDDRVVSRAMVAKMLALTFNDMNTINSLDYEITFSDVDAHAWYACYVNAAYVQGLMAGAGDVFLPEEPLTLGQAHSLLAALDAAHEPGIALSTENQNKPISYALWVELYKKLLEGASEGRGIYDAFGVEGTNVIVLGTPGNNTALSEGQMIADMGAFFYQGLAMDDYIDREIRVFHKNKEIIALAALVDEQPTLKNAYVTDVTQAGIGIFSGGVKRFYTYGQNCAAAPPDCAGTVCDIKINSGEALSVTVYAETISGTIMRTTNDAIELKEWGKIPLDARFKTYAAADGAVKWKSSINLLVGTDAAFFYICDGVLRAGVITKNVKPEQIRVAIGASNYTGLIHRSVTVTSNGPFTVKVGSEEKKYTAGQRFTVSDLENTDLFGQERVYIKSDEADGTLQLYGLKRNWSDNASPRYRGVIEIAREDGGYSIVNELGLEEYLYAVLPSEMPSSYGVEASKVQAVTARSYAYNQFYENRFHAYGGNVDDSVSCQVYNNIPENASSIQAVNETRGQCLTYKDSVITANFFSTSSGMTANSGEVWPSPSKSFPTATSEYLKARPQFSGDNAYGDLTKEENAAAFFKDTAVSAYDSGFSWFRWQVHMTAEELAASINAQLSARYKAAPALVKTLLEVNGKAMYRSRPVENIGELTDLQVIKRGEGGNVMELLITGTEAAVLVSTEYNIRVLLSPASSGENGRDITLTRSDGSAVINYSLMPSAFFTFEAERDENGRLTGMTFYGGGNGHGVGMSQNGVKGMIDGGFGFADVLTHFYPGTEIKKMH